MWEAVLTEYKISGWWRTLEEALGCQRGRTKQIGQRRRFKEKLNLGKFFLRNKTLVLECCVSIADWQQWCSLRDVSKTWNYVSYVLLQDCPSTAMLCQMWSMQSLGMCLVYTYTKSHMFKYVLKAYWVSEREDTIGTFEAIMSL